MESKLKNKMKTAVILCGGRGTRLGSLGRKIPKALVKVQKKEILIQQGLSKDQCKKINQFIKSTKTKVQPQTQSDSVRVSSKKKDDLQAVMQAIKGQDFDFDVQFTNYR